MNKSKSFGSARFKTEVILEAHDLFITKIPVVDRSELIYDLYVSINDEEWKHDSLEEYFADYRKSNGSSTFRMYYGHNCIRLTVDKYKTEVSIEAPTRGDIESIFSVFEETYEESIIKNQKESTLPKIFIGHGRSNQWKELKDHLQDKHGYKLIAYEIGARAGHSIRDILDDMLTKSDLALLVMTGEDETTDGKIHARENVIHEIGLFQGRLGFSKAIIILENGTNEFSNISGIEQIRFSKNNIKETFGDVIATINREL